MNHSSSISGPVPLHNAQVCAPEDIVVYAEGGAICSEQNGGRYAPSEHVIHHLCVEVARSLPFSPHQIHIVIPDSGPVLSEDVGMERVGQFATSLQSLFKDFRARHVVVLSGSHKLPRYGTASMLALSPQDLGVGVRGNDHFHDESGSLIIASTRHAANVDKNVAVATVRDALQLSKLPQMRGRGAALYREKLYALPGIDRPKDADYLDSRFPLRGHKTQGSWFIGNRQPFDVPIGDGSPLDLDHEVRTYVFGGDNTSSTDAMINALWDDKINHKLHGVILKKSNGSHPLSYCEGDNLASIDSMHIPVIAVGEHNAESSRVTESGIAYQSILDGGGNDKGTGKSLYSGEAKLLLAYWLKGAEKAGYSDIQDIVAFIRQKLEAYPFR